MLQPAVPFYKALAVDSSRAQVSIDLFLFSGQYVDIATLSKSVYSRSALLLLYFDTSFVNVGGCAKYTGGSVYYYPNFNASKTEDALKFTQEFSHFLARPIGLEAVLRVRATKGIRSNLHLF